MIDQSAISSSLNTSGTSFGAQPPPIIAKRDPTTSDTGYLESQIWINELTPAFWVNGGDSNALAQWIIGGTGTTAVNAVVNGGTGRATLTNHGVLVGAGTTAITQLAVAATGTVLAGVSGADPAFTASPTVISLTTTNLTASSLALHGVVLGGAGAAMTSLAVASTGTVLTGVTGADPAFSATPALTSLAIGAGGLTITSGTGAPSASEPKGSLYLRTDGSGVNDRAYIATDAVGTWTPIVTVG
ncbi:MAG: hypothetical protein ACYC0F_19195 [Rhodanobacter sp.]